MFFKYRCFWCQTKCSTNIDVLFGVQLNVINVLYVTLSVIKIRYFNFYFNLEEGALLEV